MKMEKKWNYELTSIPLEEILWLTIISCGEPVVVKGYMREFSSEVVAWMRPEPQPQPARPPKPKQLHFLDCEELPLDSVIVEVEQRTREIIDWEQKYEVKK